MEARKLKAGRFFWEGSNPIPTTYGVQGSAVSSLSGVRGGASETEEVFCYFSSQDGVSG